MTHLGPLFLTVTWGAGGSTSEMSLELAKYAQSLGITTCLHLTCTNMDRHLLDNALELVKSCGIRNILALRGDPPRDMEYNMRTLSEFSHAVDLVKYIRERYGDYFCIGVAGYPEGHVDGSDSSNQDPIRDIPYLIEKVKAGADFIITQLFYDSEKFLNYEKLLRDHQSKVFRNLTIIPGLLPISTYQSFIRTAKLSHASIPDKMLHAFNRVKGNDEDIKQLGIKVITDIVDTLYFKTNGKTRGFHFYTLNLEKSIALILETSKVLPLQTTSENLSINKGISNNKTYISLPNPSTGKLQDSGVVRDRGNDSNAHNRVIVETRQQILKNSMLLTDGEKAGIKTSNIPLTSDFFAISSGEGALGREANWDDFPNGRFGDSRSPAYGEIDGYGPSIHVDRNKAFKLWGYPVNNKDISGLFISHITGQLEAIPWSDQTLDPETALIQEQLISLNRNEMWTVSSQPACDGAKSNDRIFGWGPPSGQVFQKPFVEFFISPEKWEELMNKKLKSDEYGHLISYYACTSSQELITNTQNGASNAVTWGVFPNREILQSTLIEKESFLAWAKEAFSIWREWQLLYPKKSPTSNLIENIASNYYLVALIHHDYKDEFALWNLLI